MGKTIGKGAKGKGMLSNTTEHVPLEKKEWLQSKAESAMTTQ